MLLIAQDQSNANPQETNKTKQNTKLKFLSLLHNIDLNLRSQDQAQDDCNCIQNYVCLFHQEEGPKGFRDSKERLRTTEVDFSRIPKTQQ